ncbi:MAG: MBL fold metallo-hydrolase [Chloroflexi bacterium]|nr:MBL fold metallo-hydrolase [Chloroflexota bacterium]
MEITWYGLSCFRLKSRGVTVITDPYNPESGLRVPRQAASVITVSHAHDDHCCTSALRAGAYIVSGPGIYEVQGAFVIGISTFHDKSEGAERGRNTAYRIELENLSICHLGDIGNLPNQEQIELLTGADVLMLPVGGRSTISAADAAETVSLLEPRIVIPMHYKIPGLFFDLDTPTRFIKALGVESTEKLETLTVTRSELGSDPPEQVRVVLLEPKQ